MDASLTIDIPDGVYDEAPGWSGMVRHPGIMPLVAGSYPVKPPSEWFANPNLGGLTPLTIEDDGRVYGHIAAWHTSHIGMAGGVKPPRSKSGYAYYQTGVVACSDGKMVNVGQITLTGGHAPLNVGVAKAVAHYDDTASAIMDVSAGEDRHGIWVAGALRPDVTDAQLRAIRASSVSGDWRPINGKLELVAVCAVNSPGFPIPRARVASGAPIALVAAGIEPLIEIAMRDRIEANVEQGIAAGLELFRERILRLEDVVLAGAAEEPDNESQLQAEQLRRRVRGGSALAASLRERVRGQKNYSQDTVDDVQALAAALRERVRGDVHPKALAPETALTAARKDEWDPNMHPRGADGRFIEKGSWVRWLNPEFGSKKRGRITGIVNDEDSVKKYGVTGKPIAVIEFIDENGDTTIEEVPFDELERVAPPKGFIDEEQQIEDTLVDQDGDGLGDAVADRVNIKLDDSSGVEEAAVKDAVEEAIEEVVSEVSPDEDSPTNAELEAEELKDNFAGGTEAVANDDWINTSKWYETLQNRNSEEADEYADTLSRESFNSTGEWARALHLARADYEAWRIEKLLGEDDDRDFSMDAYLEWLKNRGMNAAIIAALRSEVSVHGEKSLLARATSYWTEERRAAAAKEGIALPDGSYPIADKEDLKKAIQSYGRAKNKIRTKRHIMRRASILGAIDMIPDGWAGRTMFDPAKHLRGPDGRFVPKGGKTTTRASASDTSKINPGELRDRVHKNTKKNP